MNKYAALFAIVFLSYFLSGSRQADQPFTTNINNGFELNRYTISECKKNCTIITGILSEKINKGILDLKIGAVLNCSVNSATKINYVLANDTLNLLIPQFHITRDTIAEKTNSTYSITVKEERSHLLCDCLFEIDLTFNNCNRVPRTILINGNSIDKK
jgi:hypothetical protein